MNLKKYSIGIGIFILALVLPLIAVAQDAYATATEIPVLPDTTQESAAPQAPEIAPPNISGDTGQTTAPEATQAVTANISTTSVCPVAVQDSFTATEILCSDINSGEACIGNGKVDSVFGADVTGVSFAQANDRVRLTSLDQLSLDSSSGAWTVVTAKIELTTTDGGATATASMLVFGDVSIEDKGQVGGSGVQNATVLAQSGMNVRRTPATDGVVVWQLQAGEQVVATGITADRQWIRIVIPNVYQGTGWVYAPYLNVEGGTDTLPFVNQFSAPADLTPPEFGPMQSIELLTGKAQADCGSDIPDSGILLQSPSGIPDAIRYKVNGVEIQLSGTAFIEAQAGATLSVSVLEGEATVINGSSVNATAGNRATVSLDNNLAATGSPTVTAFDTSIVDLLPVRLLPRQFALGAVDTTQNTGFVTSTPSTGFGTPAATATSEACILTALDSVRNIRSGPSTEYETMRVLQPNETVVAIGQAVGELNLTWYETAESGWLRIDTVSASPSCSSLPVVEVPPPPSATATPELGTTGLNSSSLGEIACDGTQKTDSTTSDGSDYSVQIGGTWTVAAGTTVTFTTNGGQLRPEFGSYIQLIAGDGTVLASSAEGRSLQVKFDQNATFSARFSAGNGDVVLMGVTCQ